MPVRHLSALCWVWKSVRGAALRMVLARNPMHLAQPEEKLGSLGPDEFGLWGWAKGRAGRLRLGPSARLHCHWGLCTPDRILSTLSRYHTNGSGQCFTLEPCPRGNLDQNHLRELVWGCLPPPPPLSQALPRCATFLSPGLILCSSSA